MQSLIERIQNANPLELANIKVETIEIGAINPYIIELKEEILQAIENREKELIKKV